jgi:hypothetical protein
MPSDMAAPPRVVALQQDNALHLPSCHATRKRCPPGEYKVAQGAEAVVQLWAGGEARRPVTVVVLPGRGRPPQAAARRAGLEV